MNSNAGTLRVAAFPRANLLTDVLLVLAGTGLIAASAQTSVKLPFTPVPITGQTFAVVLVGASLGSLCGTASAILYLWLGVAGAPIYAHHDSGWDVITSASGGYIVGFVLAAAASGFLAERGWTPVFLLDRRDVDRERDHLPGRSSVACRRPRHEPREDPRVRALPVRAGRHVQAHVAAAFLPTAWRLVGRCPWRHSHVISRE